MQQSQELPILETFVSAYKQWRLMYPQVPKSYRYTLGNRMESLFQHIMDELVTCRYAQPAQKRRALQSISVRLDLLKWYLKLLWEMRGLDHKKYAALARPLLKTGQMLGGWIKTCS